MRRIRDYKWAESPSQALEWMTTTPGKGAFLAGGTVLAVRQDPGLDFVVDLSRAGLDGIQEGPGGLEIGATCTLQRLLEDPRASQAGGGILAAALRATRTDPWRRQATLAGRLLEGEPGDLLGPTLLVLDARLGLHRPGSPEPEWLELAAALKRFFPGPAGGSTSVRNAAMPPAPGLVAALRLPPIEPGWGFALERLARSALDVPLAAVAAGVQSASGHVQQARIAVRAPGGPARAPRAEAAAQLGEPGNWAAAVEALRSEFEWTTDWRASAAYRRQASGVLLARALHRALLAVPHAPR